MSPRRFFVNSTLPAPTNATRGLIAQVFQNRPPPNERECPLPEAWVVLEDCARIDHSAQHLLAQASSTSISTLRSSGLDVDVARGGRSEAA